MELFAGIFLAVVAGCLIAIPGFMQIKKNRKEQIAASKEQKEKEETGKQKKGKDENQLSEQIQFLEEENAELKKEIQELEDTNRHLEIRIGKLIDRLDSEDKL